MGKSRSEKYAELKQKALNGNFKVAQDLLAKMDEEEEQKEKGKMPNSESLVDFSVSELLKDPEGEVVKAIALHYNSNLRDSLDFMDVLELKKTREKQEDPVTIFEKQCMKTSYAIAWLGTAHYERWGKLCKLTKEQGKDQARILYNQAIERDGNVYAKKMLGHLEKEQKKKGRRFGFFRRFRKKKSTETSLMSDSFEGSDSSIRAYGSFDSYFRTSVDKDQPKNSPQIPHSTAKNSIGALDIALPQNEPKDA